MSQRHAKADRAAVILQVKRVTREPERFGETVHDRGDMIERVGECLRVRPVAVPEARIVGRDQAIRSASRAKRGPYMRDDEGSRAAGEAAGRLSGPLPIEDGKPIDLNRAIRTFSEFHWAFLLLGAGHKWKGCGQRANRARRAHRFRMSSPAATDGNCASMPGHWSRPVHASAGATSYEPRPSRSTLEGPSPRRSKEARILSRDQTAIDRRERLPIRELLEDGSQSQ